MKEVVLHDVETSSPEETARVAEAFGASLQVGDIVLLSGDLGAGKTCFSGGMVQALGVSPLQVSSPTFAIMNRYEGTVPVYHFDLYRIKSAREARDAGVEEYAGGDGIALVEWPEVAKELFYPPYYQVELAHREGGKRRIRISRVG